MWAMGAIMAELFTSRPLFPGTSTTDQIYMICQVIGTPTDNHWRKGLKFASALNYNFPLCDGVPLSVLIPSASEDEINLITKLCSWDPRKRPTALEALQHPFFQNCFHIPPSMVFTTHVNKPSTSVATMTALENKSLPRRLPPNRKPPGFDYPANPRISTTSIVATTPVFEKKSLLRKLPPNSKPPGFDYPVKPRIAIKNLGNNVKYNLSKEAAELEPKPRCHPLRKILPTELYHTEIMRRDSEVTEMLTNVELDLQVPPMMTGKSWIRPIIGAF